MRLYHHDNLRLRPHYIVTNNLCTLYIRFDNSITSRERDCFCFRTLLVQHKVEVRGRRGTGKTHTLTDTGSTRFRGHVDRQAVRAHTYVHTRGPLSPHQSCITSNSTQYLPFSSSPLPLSKAITSSSSPSPHAGNNGFHALTHTLARKVPTTEEEKR